jgi:hypothetical protein
MLKSVNDDINQIMDWFDFARVATVMGALDWKWYDTGLPSEPEIREYARKLINSTVNSFLEYSLTNAKVPENYTNQCGGFKVTVSPGDEYKTLYISLEFIVSSWDNYD